MLLLEDTIAHAQRPFGICLGAAMVTLHRFLDPEMLTIDQLALAIANFASLKDVILPITCRHRLQSLRLIDATASNP